VRPVTWRSRESSAPAQRRQSQSPPHPDPGCEAAIGERPPAVEVVKGTVEVVVVALVRAVLGVVDTFFEGVTDTS
jgi:hypothetical protein